MTRTVLIVSVLAGGCALVAVSAVIFAQNRTTAAPEMSGEQRAAREKFFGTGKDLSPIEKGQEMRPRW
ncbi:entry exclusion protein TrbK [Rhizobium pusense]|uniref:Entry exclusion protein TrbK n=3 Tax=Hyphomicrobiales TaxID=356 RepID=A0A256H0N4_9HYPH|nr:MULTISPECIES: entry exclusion protein TrbK [Hyphomicrobiales]QCM13840.1 entry exclusion protein TrbK [Agrobacterium tumefaciens]KAB2701536.1 entry exclusion protein TrbK [Brucella lupini]MDH0912450.1 entry exclusion protein TrbK [Agrobacterium pusense]MDH1098556.1 entry exclusion protein TrbK [Agrobacterium pusense]MDH1115266.1 entry exclusion protein TrbK [Agrobacterium pusense]